MRTLVGSVLIVGMTAAPALAQQPPVQPSPLASGSRAGVARAASALTASPSTGTAAQPAAPSKPYTLTAGADFPTAYVFRGILQEDKGVIVEPFVDFGFEVRDGLTLNVGSWNSTHSGPTGSTPFDSAWYETDFYGSATFSAGRFTPGVLFTSYNSPNNVFNTVNELALVLPFDDSANAFSLSPKAVLAFELSGQADNGDNTGIYLELGVRPSIATGTPVTISVPAKFGLSLKDYYEGPTGSNGFGYFTTGASASVPLPSTSAVSWELHGGVDFYWFGDNLQILNHDDSFKPVGTIGFTISY